MTPQARNFDERARVAALRRYGLLEDSAVPDLDALARVARSLCGTATAALNLVDEDTMFTPCYPGLFPMRVDRSLTFCEPAIERGELVYAVDVNDDPRWASHPLVGGDAPVIRTHAAAPLITPDGFTIGTLCVSDPARVPLTDEQLTALQDLADAAMHLIEGRLHTTRLRSTLGELALVASRDSLTGVASRQQVLAELTELAAAGVAHTVLFVDLDRFKDINDHHGHGVGDRVLEAIGARLRAACRGDDLVGRIGGDEFVVVARATEPAVVAAIASRFGDLIGDDIVTAAGRLRVAASIGWAVAEPGEDPTGLLDRADQAMYEIKAARQATSRR